MLINVFDEMLTVLIFYFFTKKCHMVNNKITLLIKWLDSNG